MKVIVVMFMAFLVSSFSCSACMNDVKIKSLWPREGGWVHIEAEGINDIDISNCGANNNVGMILNFNDSASPHPGTVEGKRMIYSALLTALTTGKPLNLCSEGCDTQYSSHSRLSYIDNMR